MNTAIYLVILFAAAYLIRWFYLRQVEAMRETEMWAQILADVRAGKYDTPEATK